MAVYLVTWNINKEGKQYNASRAALIKRIDTYTNKQDAGLESVRFISTTDSASAVSDDLLKALDNDDRLMVTRLVSGEHQGWLMEATWQWIDERL